MDRCVTVLLTRRNLAASLSDLDSIIAAIDQFLLNVQAVLLFLVLLVAFSSGSGELADSAVTAGASILWSGLGLLGFGSSGYGEGSGLC